MRTVDIQEQEIFIQAIEIQSPIKRLDFVYQACGTNENLRRRIEKLLKLKDKDDFILDKTVGLDSEGNITTDPCGVADLSGTTIGNFHLVRQIGSGGMGDVYLAEQKEPIRRRVAVKVIKLGLDTENFVARFGIERQALALMDHQGITKVLDAGSTRTGRPYLVMELVSGQPITQSCDEQTATIEERLDVFIQLCEAIQHAHQKGIIHRDLKPSNILVTKKDKKLVSKVIDFGVSKAIFDRKPGHTDLTKMACMIGTPEYMSPEQTDTQGTDQDIRTDIYSLGAVLFELLTGTTPFELEKLSSKNLRSVREIIQTRSIETPSTRISKLVDVKPQIFRNRKLPPAQLNRQLKGNLDAIVLKCLNKDRAERYPSVAELESDLRQHLAGEPISVVRQTWITKLTRNARRYKKTLAVSAIATAMLITISIVSVYSTIKANRSSHRANMAESNATHQLGLANKARRTAEIEKARYQALEKKYALQNRDFRNEGAMIRAIARFNSHPGTLVITRTPASTTNNRVPMSVSKSLKAHFNDRVVALLPDAKLADSANGDTMLLELILEEQRQEFGTTDNFVARTIDLLGERRLNAGEFQAATACFRESLLIRTELGTEPLNRIRTITLLAKSLAKSGASVESQTYIDSALKQLEAYPNETRLRRQLDIISQN